MIQCGAAISPERDLWLVGGGSKEVRERYSQLAGRRLNNDAIRFYSIAWQLTDLASLLKLFRRRHDADDDAEYSWRLLSQSKL